MGALAEDRTRRQDMEDAIVAVLRSNGLPVTGHVGDHFIAVSGVEIQKVGDAQYIRRPIRNSECTVIRISEIANQVLKRLP